jgi:lipopolysaccharide export system protein LptA
VRPLARRLLPPLGLAFGAALGAAASAQSLQQDTQLPIEITADALEVVQPDRVATFSGNVDAVQGELVLSADQLRVHYRGSGEDQADDAGQAPPAAGRAGSIRRIEAIGNVSIASPRETATGEVGVYDVVGNLVTLEGAVVLSRDDNVIRGERLEMDLSTGRSRVIAKATSAQGAPPEQRVRAIFTPSEEAPADRPAEPAARAPGSAGTGAAGGGERTSQGGVGRGPVPAPKPAPEPAG